jgi:hypothetical protein
MNGRGALSATSAAVSSPAIAEPPMPPSASSDGCETGGSHGWASLRAKASSMWSGSASTSAAMRERSRSP